MIRLMRWLYGMLSAAVMQEAGLQWPSPRSGPGRARGLAALISRIIAMGCVEGKWGVDESQPVQPVTLMKQRGPEWLRCRMYWF